MVAWWLRAVTVWNVGLWLVWMLWAWPRSVPMALVGTLLFAVAGRIWMASQFLCLQWVRHSTGEPPLPWSVVARAWNAECHISLRAFGWNMPWKEYEPPDALPDQSNAKAGVVLVHGWMCNRAVWADAMRVLQAQGIPCVAVSMPILLHRIGTGRDRIDTAAQRMQQATGWRPVVVAHSMGGLMVRDWLRSLSSADVPHRPAAVITVGSPHHGTWMARWAWGANVLQMRPNSAWLQALAAEEAQPHSAARQVRWHCMASDADNVVMPGQTAFLPHAHNEWLHGMAHVEMLYAPRLWAVVQQELEAASQAGAQIPQTAKENAA